MGRLWTDIEDHRVTDILDADRVRPSVIVEAVGDDRIDGQMQRDFLMRGELQNFKLSVKPAHALCVDIAAKGYPDAYAKGDVITFPPNSALPL